MGAIQSSINSALTGTAFLLNQSGTLEPVRAKTQAKSILKEANMAQSKFEDALDKRKDVTEQQYSDIYQEGVANFDARVAKAEEIYQQYPALQSGEDMVNQAIARLALRNKSAESIKTAKEEMKRKLKENEFGGKRSGFVSNDKMEDYGL